MVALLFSLLTDAAVVTIGILARIYFIQEGQDPNVVLGTGGEDVLSMITGFASVLFFKFIMSNIESVSAYFIELDVLAPSFALAMIVGYIVSKIFPNKNPKKELSETIE